LPDDGNGAVGPAHFVELINGRFSVYNKSNGVRVQTMNDLTFWAKAGVSLDPTLDTTDPRVNFDADAQRWFASCIDYSPAAFRQTRNHFLLAVSDSPDPTGSWHGFSFTADPVNGDFADFPTMGLDADGVYLAGDLYTTALGLNIGSTLVFVPKAGLLGNPPNIDGRVFLDPLAFNAHGHILQPAVALSQTSAQESVLGVGSLGGDGHPHNTLLLSTVRGGTMTNTVALQVPDYIMAGGLAQPNGSTNLDSGDTRFSAAVRRVGDVLYAVHSVANSGRVAVRWYRIDAQQMTLLETGIISNTNLDLSYPSIAANASGTVVVACNGSGSKSFVSCYAAAGQVQNGSLSFGALTLLKAGTASYRALDSTGMLRWGDYSATTVDPVDSTHFWTIQTYPVSASNWATQITEIVTGAQLSITLTTSGLQISWPASQAAAQLQYTSRLPQVSGWTAVPQSPVISEGKAIVTLPLSGNQGYFRLAQ
jgi:hypothetical protein